MQIDVISDTVCPWCFIGKRRLSRALALRPGIAFDVHWRPYRLNPDMPRAGMPRQDYLAAKFGAQAGNMHDLVIADAGDRICQSTEEGNRQHQRWLTYGL